MYILPTSKKKIILYIYIVDTLTDKIERTCQHETHNGCGWEGEDYSDEDDNDDDDV